MPFSKDVANESMVDFAECLTQSTLGQINFFPVVAALEVCGQAAHPVTAYWSRVIFSGESSKGGCKSGSHSG